MVSIQSNMADSDNHFLNSSPSKRFKPDSDLLLANGNALIDDRITHTASGIKENTPKKSDAVTCSDEFYTGADSGFSEICMTPPISSGTSDDMNNSNTFFPDTDNSMTDIKSHRLADVGEMESADRGEEENANNEEEEEEDDDDEVASTVSNLSGLSDFSDVSGQGWKPVAGPMSWIQRQMLCGSDPRSILLELVPSGTVIPDQLDKISLWRIIFNMLSEPPCREKLTDVNTLGDVVGLLQTCQNIIVLTGAGVSVSCGIPDFRSRDGIYARLSKDFPNLPDPQAMFDISYFRRDPRPFFKFAREIYPGQFKPSIGHRFIKAIERHGRLLRNYTQNIDTLEQVAGINSVIQCHGSFATATCTRCKTKVDSSVIKEEIFQKKLPYCQKCEEPCGSEEKCLLPAIMKPDIVFFGEGLSDEFHDSMTIDKDKCDLLIVIGSSLKVRPVALIPSSIPASVPQILINREPLNHMNFDVELLGDSDVIINELALRLGSEWSNICNNSTSLTEVVCNSSCQLHGNKPADTPYPGDTAAPDSTYDVEEAKCSCPKTTDLPENSYSYEAPSRYIFQGAEISGSCKSRIAREDSVNDPEDKPPEVEELGNPAYEEVEKHFINNASDISENFADDERCTNLPESTTSDSIGRQSNCAEIKDSKTRCDTSSTDQLITSSS